MLHLHKKQVKAAITIQSSWWVCADCITVVGLLSYFAHSRERLEELFAVSFTNVFVGDVYSLYCVGMRLFDTD